ncbi:tetratricopeptide repeat protein [Pseudemcibacter aquimaris]|uniref:tetratricopeptide repeat protein n=1 Tax=Pseudemcibacter aquimaris TaxID=2857064 RepID=UPI0020139DDF|nr:tetratricopeptide repeat protein [Pseudemcibacter aquimaris]MCC3860003.1 tetratricopeptide repeat protein [Pseudemcibacter aquimaris]WDU57334.1 tetratricopeptide repeat protein [Pseudemcibacter aquimaris]
MSDEFIREVDDDLRQKQINDLWKKYGKFVIGMAFGIVAIVAGRAIYTSVVEGQYQEQASLYEEALLQNADQMSASLNQVANGGVAGFELLATLKKAQLAIEADNREEAISILDGFAKNSDMSQIYKDMVNIQVALLEVDTASLDQIRSRLSLILNGDNRYGYMATEIMALAELKAGETDAAKTRLETLIGDVDAPGSIKTRAEQYLSVIE